MLAGTVLAAILVSPAAAEDPAAPASSQAAPPSTRTITLVTGDVVRLTTFADGRQGAVVDNDTDSWQITEQDGAVYAIPAKAEPYLAAGVLDEELFNLTELAASRYDDASRPSLPVLVTYGRSVKAASADEPTGAVKEQSLPSVNGAALEVAKNKADDFWDSIVREGSAKLDGGLSGIWLDSKVSAVLDQSVPQIGAPQVWAAGFNGAGVQVAVLDTGIDDTHPDLAGRVKKSKNFTEDPDVYDDHSHGTHVASTIAGNGDRHKGVAPAADLFIGKVLNHDGDGTESDIIAGMEWAVAEGADIVNMSLGGDPTDGTDPLAQAVNRLSASGTLFVIAAGNNGRSQTVTSPASASAALSVGAVDGADALASFSSRGPRLGDYAIKPEITAPGVDIDAANPHPRDPSLPWNPYRRSRGTSMASPHVAGAAALLKQQHPDWSGERLKAALVSTARPNPANSVYEQGAGRLDAERAHRQSVHASHGVVDFGFLPWPYDAAQQPVDKTLTYTNTGAQPVTLTLALDKVTGPFALSASSLEVPAQGSAEVTVTYTPAGSGPGTLGGWVRATAGDGTELRTAIGAAKEQEMYDLRVPVLGRDGKPAVSGSVTLWGVDARFSKEVRLADDPEPVFRVPPGRYSLMAMVSTLDSSGKWDLEVSALGNPELGVTGDATVTLDARQAKEIRISTPRESTVQDSVLGYRREAGGRTLTRLAAPLGSTERVYATPTPKVTEGFFEFFTQVDLLAPRIRATDAGRAIPMWVMGLGEHAGFDGRHLLRVVDAGSGRPQDFPSRKIKGAIALIKRTDGVEYADQIAGAKKAGAAVALVYDDRPGRLVQTVEDAALPAFYTSQEEGERLLERARSGELRLELRGTMYSPYSYDVITPMQGGIPENLGFTVDRTNAARTISRYTASGTGNDTYTSTRFFFRPWDFPLSVDTADQFPAPFVREEWVSAGDTSWQHDAVEGGDLIDFSPMYEVDRVYQPGQELSQTFFGAVLHPGTTRGSGHSFCNCTGAYWDGDGLFFTIAPALDGDANHSTNYLDHSLGVDESEVKARVYRNGQLIAEESGLNGTYVPAQPERATYRAEMTQARDPASWALSTKTSTAWTFTTEKPASDEQRMLPLVMVDYALDLDLYNRAPRGRPYSFGISLRQTDPQGPRITQAKVWTSMDDGTTWKPADVSGANGSYTVRPHHPSRGGFVSLRVQGSDAAGNTVEQTIIRAYGLTGR
ncbi:S8 family peptidase [Nonomuraea turcica]|uniref:S8 family peptidase n=1 Tax=Nonomuraea sp. G32 TaxID=3067274 RepID=UPI00273CF0B2|nr:S8 family serine peptidase [Nonomuraea sp. G32]MDP4509312.1 S8 family serine peptidase [Nonomuraea sp. G32]